MIVCRIFGREVFALGGVDPDLDPAEDVVEPDLTGGSFELADHLDPEDTVYLRSTRQRPPVVVVGGKPGQRGAQGQTFGFARLDRLAVARSKVDKA